MKNQSIDVLAWLQNWYASQCDGMWEQEKRIQITTLDNPGWRVKINLKDTVLMGKKISIKEKGKSDNDNWIDYWVKDDVFEAAGGSRNLVDILNVFRRWVEDGVI